jgi:hypothetical protein
MKQLQFYNEGKEIYQNLAEFSHITTCSSTVWYFNQETYCICARKLRVSAKRKE